MKPNKIIKRQEGVTNETAMRKWLKKFALEKQERENSCGWGRGCLCAWKTRGGGLYLCGVVSHEHAATVGHLRVTAKATARFLLCAVSVYLIGTVVWQGYLCTKYFQPNLQYYRL